MRSKQARIGLGTAMFILLFCGTSIASERDEAPPPLELLATASRIEIGKPVQLLLVRRDAASHQPVTIYGPPGAMLWVATTGGCSSRSNGVASLQLDGNLPDVINVCMSLQSTNSRARVSAVATVQQHVLSAVSDVIEVNDPPDTNIFSTPLMAIALPAAIGFLFGLGSSFFQVWLEKWKNARLAASEAQKFIATTLFPEMLEHAERVRAFLTAPQTGKLILSTQPLAVPKITAALQSERVAQLTKYFSNLSLATFTDQLRSYDNTLSQFNHEANALVHVPQNQRNLLSQEDFANRLKAHLSAWGLY